MVGGRRNPLHLTPLDILRQLPAPYVPPQSSLTAMARQLDVRRERLERAMKARSRHDFVPQSGILRLPSTARLEGLLEQIEALPRHRKCLDRAQFRVYLATLLRVRDALVLALRKIRRHEQCDYQRGYLARVGAIYLDSPPDVFASFLAGKRNRRGQNAAAVAMARMRRATSQQLSEWGRKGAESRRQKRALIAAAGPTSNPSVSSANEFATASAPESE